MGYQLQIEDMKRLFDRWKADYTLLGPRRMAGEGMYSDTDVIRYGELENWEDLEWDQRSHYSFKEAVLPITQILFYFTEETVTEAQAERRKPALIFLRSCDIHAIKRLDEIYLRNRFEDQYYRRLRDNIKLVLMSCPLSCGSGFCVSMGTNKTDDYSLALKFSDEGVQVQVTDETFAPYFEGMPQAGYTPAFVEENELKVTVPDLDDKAVRLALKSHPMWKEFDGRCISCGACTVACSTCTCFTTRDVIYGDNPEVGERRRVTASCQIAGFDQMAGQREFRSTAGERMRYKVLHKFHDYKARFGEGHMCVGCGRCTHRCPELISISATVNKVNAAVNEIKAGLAQQ